MKLPSLWSIPYVLLVSAIAPLSVWLLRYAITWRGVGLALIALILIVLPATLWGWLKWRRSSYFWLRLNIGLLLNLLILGGFILYTLPQGKQRPNSPVSHQFTSNVTFQPFRLTNIIPEAEQINLGFTLIPYIDPIFDQAQAKRTYAATMKLYRDMEADPNFYQLGSVLGWSYAELLGQPYNVGHYYLYIPTKSTTKPRPALVFLHGSMGNFKPYLWVLSKLAEQAGIVIIAPSFGFGNWLRQGGEQAVLDALTHAQTLTEIDPERIYLAGLSNGGLGATLVADITPASFQGLIYLSPVIPTIINKPTFLQAWQGRPMLIISGEADQRIPLRFVQEKTTVLEDAGVAVTLITYPNEDHFLFFAQPESILNHISDWLKIAE